MVDRTPRGPQGPERLEEQLSPNAANETPKSQPSLIQKSIKGIRGSALGAVVSAFGAGGIEEDLLHPHTPKGRPIIAAQTTELVGPSPKDLAWAVAWDEECFKYGFENWLQHQSPQKLLKATGRGRKIIACIDERINLKKGMDRVALAGSGVLFQEDQKLDLESRMQKLVEELHDKGINGVSSHDGCMACKMACPPGMDPDVFAEQWAKELAKRLRVPYVGQLNPDMGFHDAISMYYNGNKKFSHPEAAGLPHGLRVSRWLFSDPSEGVHDLKLSKHIALGDHGFGDRFTPEQPFTVIIVPDETQSELSGSALLQEVEQAIGKDDRIQTVVLPFSKPRNGTLHT